MVNGVCAPDDAGQPVTRRHWRPAALALCVALAGMLAVPFVNRAVDRYRVLSGDDSRWYRFDGPDGRDDAFNALALRLRHVLRPENRARYDSFVFGSSRLFAWDLPSGLGDNWYRLTDHGGTPAECVRILRHLVDHHDRVKAVILVVDHFYFSRAVFDAQAGKPNRLTLPNSMAEAFEFYRTYLYQKPDWHEWAALTGQARLEPMEPELHWSVANPGRAHWDYWAAGRIKEAPETWTPDAMRAHLYERPTFAYTARDQMTRVEPTLAEIREFVGICKARNIAVTLVVNPFHAEKNLYAMDVNGLEYWKTELAKIAPYYDFSDPADPVVHESAYWIEESHYMPQVAAWMMQMIRTGERVALPAGWRPRIIPEAAVFARLCAWLGMTEPKDEAARFGRSVSAGRNGPAIGQFREMLRGFFWDALQIDDDGRPVILRRNWFPCAVHPSWGGVAKTIQPYEWNIHLTTNNQVTNLRQLDKWNWSAWGLRFRTIGNAPSFDWPLSFPLRHGPYELALSIRAPKPQTVTVEYWISGDDTPHTAAATMPAKKCELIIPIPAETLVRTLRIRPGTLRGKYEIYTMELRETARPSAR